LSRCLVGVAPVTASAFAFSVKSGGARRCQIGVSKRNTARLRLTISV
jgi:hypothetical protein